MGHVLYVVNNQAETVKRNLPIIDTFVKLNGSGISIYRYSLFIASQHTITIDL